MDISDVFITIFIVCCVFQLYFPVLAGSIKNRFSELGYEMEANTILSMTNMTTFWSEARNKNREFNDPLIKKFLLVRTLWWVLGVGSFIGLWLSW